MLTRKQRSKMVCDIKELKDYFDERFNELKNSLDVNNNPLQNVKVRLSQICKNQKIKQIIKSKHWNQRETPSAASNSTGTTIHRNPATP